MNTYRHYSNHPDDPVYFYGGPFSNFVGGPITVTSHQPWLPSESATITGSYPTVEHFYQASKATTDIAHHFIYECDGPWESKKRGNGCVLRPDWEDLDPETGQPVKYEVMMVGLRAKFEQDTFRATLLGTDERFIAEDSPTDFIWGIRDAEGGQSGENLLGRALMQLREEIRA